MKTRTMVVLETGKLMVIYEIMGKQYNVGKLCYHNTQGAVRDLDTGQVYINLPGNCP